MMATTQQQEAGVPVTAYPPNPTQHDVLNKTVKYHQAASHGDRAKCSANVHIDMDSGIKASDLLNTERCGRCFKGAAHG